MRALACLVLLLLAHTARAEETPWGLVRLMAQLQTVKQARAHFIERKTATMLTAPVESTGTLSYVAPDRLEKITLTPAPESIMLQGDMLAGVQPNGDKFSVSLSDHPEVAALVEGVRSTMAGDIETLGRYYAIDFSGHPSEWRLVLTPLDRSVREKVDAIRISGEGTELETVSVHETDGDQSEMTVTPDVP